MASSSGKLHNRLAGTGKSSGTSGWEMGEDWRVGDGGGVVGGVGLCGMHTPEHQVHPVLQPHGHEVGLQRGAVDAYEQLRGIAGTGGADRSVRKGSQATNMCEQKARWSVPTNTHSRTLQTILTHGLRTTPTAAE